jgi:zinc transporter ZupT
MMGTFFILLLVLLAAIANLLGGWLVIRRRYSDDQMCIFIAVTAGVFLSIALIDLVPHSIELNHNSPYWILTGFAAMLFVNARGHGHIGHPEVIHHHADSHTDDHAAHHHGGNTGQRHQHRMNPASTIGIQTAMTIHTFFDGFSIMAAYMTNPNIGILVFIAIFIHKIPDGMTLSSVIIARTDNRRHAILGTLILSLSTILGSLLMLLIHSTMQFMFLTGLGFDQQVVTGGALALSAGIFLYVAAADLIPEVYETARRGISLWIIAGILLFFALETMVQHLGFGG